MVVIAPHWPLAAAAVTPGIPAVVVRANRVIAANPAARLHHVEPGMRRRESQGRCPQLEVLEHDPDRDARRFESVVSALEQFTPRVEILGPGRCSFPTRGPSRYFGGDTSLGEQVASVVDSEIAHVFGESDCPPGFRACVGVADGLFAASLAAEILSSAPSGRSDRSHLVVPANTSNKFLAPMPVSALRRWSAPIDDGEHLVDLLWRLGLRTLGDVASLPASDMLARFGTDGARAHRLASGHDERPPDTRPVPPESTIETELDPPAERVDTASFVAKTMADEMHARLARDGLACTRIIVEAITGAGESLSRTWRHEGALSANDVADRMRWQLDGWLSSRHKPTSGITLLRLAPDEVVADVGRQLGFWGGQALETERAARALARVQGLLGPAAVSLPERRGGRGLGEAIGKVPLPFVDLNDPDRKVDSPSADAPWPGRLPAPSPAVLGCRSVAEVVDANGEMVSVSGRGDLSADPAVVVWSDGSKSAVVSWAGPWPLDEKWWEPQQHRRLARFQVVLSDGGAHVMSISNRRWQHEGEYQ